MKVHKQIVRRVTKKIVKPLRRRVSRGIKVQLQEAPGVQRLYDTAMVQSLLGHTEVKDPDREWTDQGKAQTRITWRKAPPGPNLTWGKVLTGEAFIDKVEFHASFDEETTVLEVAPGYGRLLRSFLARGIPFKEYYGVDISEQNIEYLRKQFPHPAVHFMWADIEDVSLPFQFDVGFSSLTFKHLYPSFEASLRNCSRYMSPGGRFIFDLVEGNQAHFVNQGRAYVRRYSREEVVEILGRAGLEFVAFDEVDHDRHYKRLLVVATKSN